MGASELTEDVLHRLSSMPLVSMLLVLLNEKEAVLKVLLVPNYCQEFKD